MAVPQSFGYLNRTGEAMVSTSTNGRSITVTHREYIFDVTGNTSESFPTPNASNNYLSTLINPSNPQLFPWLSQMSNLYETYRFDKLEFLYEPLSPTNSAGVVMMAVDYDSTDLPPSSKQQMQSYKNATRSPTWLAQLNRSDLSDLRKQKNYYTNFTGPDGTSRFNNIGRFNLVSIGQGGTATIGELYVQYTVRFETPQMVGSPGLGVTFTASTSTLNAAILYGNLQCEWRATNELVLDMPIKNTIMTITQEGTVILNEPSVGIVGGTGSRTLISEAFQATEAISVIKLDNLTSGSVLQFSIGAATTLTKYKVSLVAVPEAVYNSFNT